MPPKGYKKNPISPTKAADPMDIGSEIVVTIPAGSTVVGYHVDAENKKIAPIFAEPMCCANCKFYGARVYSCFRYPKQSTDFYPIKPDGWCGEYVKK